MKKVYFVYTGSSAYGGLSRYLKNLFKHLPKERIELSLISVGKWPTADSIKKNGNKVCFVGGLFSLIGIAFSKRPDVLISAGVKSTLYCRLTSLILGTRVITTVHSNFEYDYKNGPKKSIFFFLDRVLRFKTKKFIAVSEYLKNSLVSSGVPEQLVEVVYNGVSFGKSSDKRQKSGFKITIGSVGRMHPTKGFSSLILAMKSLPSGMDLKIWGEGDEKIFLEKLVKSLGLEKRVSFMGHAKNINTAFAEMDIYVQPSKMEGFGLALVEAMGFGLPVVATLVGAFKEIIKDGKTGLIAKSTEPEALAEKIKELAGSEELRAKLGKSASEDVRERFNIESWGKEIEKALLKELV